MTFLSRNLTALARTNEPLAKLVAEADRSRFENDRWEALPFSADAAGVAVILGFGPHVGDIMRVMGAHGVVIVYEPDLTRIRGMLDHNNCPWLGYTNLRFCTDKAQARECLNGLETLLASGVKVIAHLPSSARLDDGFMEAFVSALKAMRTNLVTACILTERISENAIKNLPRFVASPGVKALVGACADRPGIVVSAGPSLSRNLHHLLANGYEDRFVIVATQTVLKPMLTLGIRPHYVCAIDWSDLSGRFYEGLTARDVEGIELVCQPSVHPIVPDRWPGVVRFTADQTLSDILGEDTRETHGTLPLGATVAHTCYYLARHMGCDPVILIGQDLGFTDGVYYGKGAAIHNVWSGELSELRTLEMMEHERVVRGRSHSKFVPDVHGRPMRIDVAMIAYLEQFNAMFREDAEKGLTVIDATEGGSAKESVVRMTLMDALEKHDPGTKHRIGKMARARIVSLEAEIRRERVGTLMQAAGRVP